MNARGFTVVELLVATMVTLLVIGGGALMAASARWSLAVEPATLDTTRRAREAVLSLADAIAGAGGGITFGDAGAALAAGVPVVRPLTALDEAPGSRFTALWVLRPLPGAGGRVVEPQPGPGGALALDPAGPCPEVGSVCGLRVDDVAVVFDGRGYFDVFDVGGVSEALMHVTPRAPLSRSYEAGAWVLGARVDRFGLVPQSDGSHTLTRVTWAGAREPMVDGVVDLEIIPWGYADAPEVRDANEGFGFATYGLSPAAPNDVDSEGIYADGEHCTVWRAGGVPESRLAARPVDRDALSRLLPVDLDDGPWCPSDTAPSVYDADLLRVRRLDLRIRVEVLADDLRGPSGDLFFRSGTAMRDARRWVGDRAMAFSVTIGGR